LHRMPILNKVDLVQHTNEMDQLSGFILNSQHIAYTKPHIIHQPQYHMQHTLLKQVPPHSGEDHTQIHDMHHKKSSDHHHNHQNPHQHHNNQNHNSQHSSKIYDQFFVLKKFF